MGLLVSEAGRVSSQLGGAMCDMEFPLFVSPSTTEEKLPRIHTLHQLPSMQLLHIRVSYAER
jgi:hypothetical protein